MQAPQYFFETALTYEEAERKAREKYGERLSILGQATVRIPRGPFNLFSYEGVQITGIIPRNKGTQYQGEAMYPSKLPMREPPVLREPLSTNKPLPLREPVDFNTAKEKVLAEAHAAAMKDSGKDNALKEVLAVVSTIKEKLESSGLAASKEEHPTLSRLDDLLILNDFPASYRKNLLERVRKEFSLDGINNYDNVQDKALEWIGESIKIYDNNKFRVRPRIMILVGPTGIGKTTTVAKLAANFGIDSSKRTQKRRVVLVTIDAYRIGAKEQLEKYSELMQFPCFSPADYYELKSIIADNSEGTDLLLIDTIGKNHRDLEELGKMKNILDACGSAAEVHLTLAATTKSSDLNEILKAFEPFNYRSVIITKMDETIHPGNVIGALAERSKPVSYVTDGQKVPEHIHTASVIQFLKNLEGFRVNRVKLEEMFPEKIQEQMQKWR